MELDAATKEKEMKVEIEKVKTDAAEETRK
jgi:hypothetical protein